jgi:putative restriction endonuclease
MSTKRAAPTGRSENRWTREQLVLALNLYYRIPFGRQDKRTAEVIALAKAIGRTPSAVAMKLNNFTSIDPGEKGRVKGLAGASDRDREVWAEFHANWAPMAAKSEALWNARVGEAPHGDDVEGERTSDAIFDGPTEASRTTTVRRAQAFFRRAVLSAYERRCCVSGIPLKELLVASHIIPWADSAADRVNPANGLCLSRLHDGAFDKGLVTFDKERRLVLGKRLRDQLSNDVLRQSFQRFEGKPIRLPTRCLPEERFLAYHREHRFVG